MARLPTGSTFWIVAASAIAAAKTTTIVSNATEAVVTSVAHGYANGDVVQAVVVVLTSSGSVSIWAMDSSER